MNARPIKFRVWHRGQEKMYTSGFAISINGYIGMFNPVFMNWDFITVPEDSAVIFMQYTGLKDKNGKEIYEGDIVKTRGFGKVVHEPREVIWSEGGFALNDVPSGKLAGGDWIEVIGNIYETPLRSFKKPRRKNKHE